MKTQAPHLRWLHRASSIPARIGRRRPKYPPRIGKWATKKTFKDWSENLISVPTPNSMSPLISDLHFLTRTGVSPLWIVWIPNISSGSPTYPMYLPYLHGILWIVRILGILGVSAADGIRFFPLERVTNYISVYIRHVRDQVFSVPVPVWFG
jgi:hypothetical protein